MRAVKAVEASLDSWDKIGRELLRRDPTRFYELLDVATLVVKVLDDPLSVTLEACGPIS